MIVSQRLSPSRPRSRQLGHECRRAAHEGRQLSLEASRRFGSGFTDWSPAGRCVVPSEQIKALECFLFELIAERGSRPMMGIFPKISFLSSQISVNFDTEFFSEDLRTSLFPGNLIKLFFTSHTRDIKSAWLQILSSRLKRTFSSTIRLSSCSQENCEIPRDFRSFLLWGVTQATSRKCPLVKKALGSHCCGVKHLQRRFYNWWMRWRRSKVKPHLNLAGNWCCRTQKPLKEIKLRLCKPKQFLLFNCGTAKMSFKLSKNVTVPCCFDYHIFLMLCAWQTILAIWSSN